MRVINGECVGGLYQESQNAMIALGDVLILVPLYLGLILDDKAASGQPQA